MQRVSAMTAPRECRPPERTVDESVHWVRLGEAGHFEAMQWFGGAWLQFMDPCEHWPDDIATLGYRYVGPCLPPQVGEGV